MKFTQNIGMLLLAIWLILYGVAALGVIALPAVLMGVLAIIAGVLILIGK